MFSARTARPSPLASFALAILTLMAASPGAAQETWSPVEVPGPDQLPQELLTLAEEFRAIVGWASGVPDYADRVRSQKEQLPRFRARLDAIDPSAWSVHARIDYLLLRSEMDRLDFDLRVWRQTSRNPSFYVNQAIRNVGRLLTGSRYMRGDAMPYTSERAQAILEALAQTEKTLAQGRENLTEMVPELADIALRHPGGGYYTEGGQLEYIVDNYRKWAEKTAEHFPEAEAAGLVASTAEAAEHLLAFAGWLEESREEMKGNYYIGKEALDWYTSHVLLQPYNTDQLRLMAEMERARAISYHQFEMQKNRHLPKIGPAEQIDEYIGWDNETALITRRWYTEHGHDILSDRNYIPDVRVESGEYLLPFGYLSFSYEDKPIERVILVPDDHWRAIHSNMGFRTEPAVLWGHEYWPGHVYERYVHRHNPDPIRRGHRDGAHSQGWCFYHEELPVALDFPYVRGPRGRELPYINMIQRAERISMGIDLLSAKITPDEAFAQFRENVPPLGSGLGVTREEAFEEMEGVLVRGLDHCQTGKLQIFKLLADRKMQLKEDFDLKHFHDQIITLGSVPLALLRWQITGLDDEMDVFWNPVRLSSVLEASTN